MKTNSGRNFLVFTKKEKRGVFAVLGFIALIFICSEYIYPMIIAHEKVSSNDLSRFADSLREMKTDSTKHYTKYERYDHYNDEKNDRRYLKKEFDPVFTGTMFYFDPNTLDIAGWQRLGIKERTIATIQNYLSKGGKFREPDDLRKIWGLRNDEMDRLVPYARIAVPAGTPKTYAHTDQPFEKKVYEKKTVEPVDINSGDSAAFVALPGIGPGYSRRIINFRDKLGGFYSPNQIAEVYGLPDSVFQKIKPLLKFSGAPVKKININTATNDELKAHPYIRWQLAGLILEYKKQHGIFKSLEELKKIPMVDDDLYRKLLHYLEL